MTVFSESVVEDATLACLESVGWSIRRGPEIAPGEAGRGVTETTSRLCWGSGMRYAVTGTDLRQAVAEVCRALHREDGVMADRFSWERQAPGLAPLVTKAGLEPGAPRGLPEDGIRAATCRTLTPTTSSNM